MSIKMERSIIWNDRNDRNDTKTQNIEVRLMENSKIYIYIYNDDNMSVDI